ncbi:MAG: hypothetical protein HQL95_15795 [Magnetococcales bacterium]|nr:hypothetical protein [Magnetococcales bacterium]
MSRFSRCSPLLLAAFLLAGTLQSAQSAVEPQEHNNNAPRTESGVTLNNGKPWKTDAPLRKGMEAIQRDMKEALPRIHAGTESPRQYVALARKMRNHVNGIFKQCKLPPKNDVQMHLVLDQVLQGSEAMEAHNGQASGAAMIVHALDLYGRHFEHAGWKPITH